MLLGFAFAAAMSVLPDCGTAPIEIGECCVMQVVRADRGERWVVQRADKPWFDGPMFERADPLKCLAPPTS